MTNVNNNINTSSPKFHKGSISESLLIKDTNKNISNTTKKVNLAHLSLNTQDKLNTSQSNFKPSSQVVSFVSNESISLKSISGYKEPKVTQLATGITYNEYIHSSGDKKETIRAITLNTSNLNKLDVNFSRNSSLNFEKVAKQSDVLAVMNGTFFTGNQANGKPAGDIIGTEFGELSDIDKKFYEKKGAFTIAEDSIISNIENRYSFSIDNNGKATVFRGGIDNLTVMNGKNYSNQFKMSIGGGVLLFDTSNTDGKKMYDSIGNGKNSFNSVYKNNNDERIVKSGNGGDPSRIAPRSAMGILSDGSVVMINASEGIYRKPGGNGMTPYDLAKAMKEMGCVTAIMFDGGGAPTMIAKDQNGKIVTHTTPHESDGYGNNKSMIVINK